MELSRLVFSIDRDISIHQVLLMMAFLFPCNSSVLKHYIPLSLSRFLYKFSLTLRPAEMIYLPHHKSTPLVYALHCIVGDVYQ